jgi:hypothetical protein
MKTPPYRIGYWLMGVAFLVLAQQCLSRGEYDLGWFALGCSLVWLWVRREEKKARRRTRRPGGWQPATAEEAKPVHDPHDPDEVVYDIKIYKHPEVRRVEGSLQMSPRQVAQGQLDEK